MNQPAASDLPRKVIVFPPVLPLTGFVVGAALQWLVPLGASSVGAWRPILRGVGGLVLAVGVAGFAWMVVTMKRAHTPIHNSRKPTALVENGPFRYTRNPMYLFGSVAYFGLALVLVEPWSLALLPAVILVTHYGIVLREEASLSRQFGAAFERYKVRAPRWV